MFSVIFPGQGSQIIGMGKDFFDRYKIVKELFQEAENVLNFDITKMIFEGPKEELDLTVNTQPAIFLVSYSIFNVIKSEFNIDLSKAKYFAGHSLGEYSALSCAGYLDFEKTIKILRVRGEAMQNSVPKGEGGMLAVLGVKIQDIEKILKDNEKKFNAQIANDNSDGQIVLSGKNEDLESMSNFLKNNRIKNIKLPVSAPFHCKLMNSATNIMEGEISNLEFKSPKVDIISNVTSEPVNEIYTIKKLLISQIENQVRWRETINYMINKNINKFIEIGPGKVLSGLVKRINRNAELIQINNIEDLKKL